MRIPAMLRAAALLSCALTAFSASAAQVAPPRAPEVWQPLVKRTYRLQDLNFTKPLVFSGAEAGQQIFFPTPDNVPLRSAEVNISGNYLRSNIGHLTFLVGANDVPAFALEPTESEGTFQRNIKIPTTGLNDPFIKLDLRFSSLTSENRCSEQRSIANTLAVSPASELRYEVSGQDVKSIRSAWSMLPSVVRILVPAGTMSEGQYAAAVKVALAVSAAGRTSVITTLPQIGASVDAAELVVPPALRDAPVFQKFQGAKTVKLETAADRAAYNVLRAHNNIAVGEIALGSGWLNIAMTGDATALRTAIEGRPEALRLVDEIVKHGANPAPLEKDENLELLSVLGQPIITLPNESSAAASLLGSSWNQLANAGRAEVQAAREDHKDTKEIPLTELGGNFAVQSIVEYGDWLMAFNAAQLPPGRWPSAVELEMRVVPDASDASPVVSVTLNDVLLQADRIDPKSSVVRFAANIPPYLLASQNTLRVAVQRGPSGGDCRSQTRGYAAQILPTSRLVLDNEVIDDQFFSLKGKLSKRAFVVVPTAYLSNPLESLPFVHGFLRAMNIPSSALLLKTAAADAAFNPAESFVAFGMDLRGRHKDLKVGEGRLHLTDETGLEIADIKSAGVAALTQVVRVGNHVGISVNTTTGAPMADVKVDDLSLGDVAIYDATGRIGELGAIDSRRAGLRTALLQPSALFYRYSLWIFAGLGVLGALIVMRLVRAIVENRKLKRLAQNMPSGETPNAS
ncbi:MAG: cellulose biosynthesis cyclic di-GMP-binding regulatory protein BcsB [Rhodospirillaceae bacterium]|nr:cellulose biosynthesis cyclic di-GMP-binding regulatory protein BcsB [Rhodospirillaceae bacterium]